MGRGLSAILAIFIAAACSGAPVTSPTTVGNVKVDLPAGWTVRSNPDINGFFGVAPPTGSGLLLILDSKPSVPIATADDLLRRARPDVAAVSGLPIDGLKVDDRGNGHLVVVASGEAKGENAVIAVHAFPNGQLIEAYYHGPKGDGNLPAATQIVSSAAPASQ